MGIRIILERSKVRIGDPIRGYVQTDRLVSLKFIIAAASLLPSKAKNVGPFYNICLLYTSPSPRDRG